MSLAPRWLLDASRGLNSMNWNACFAHRTGQMKRSAVRELLKVIHRPEIISFAGGLPDASLFPLPRVRAAAATVLRQVGAQSLQYGETEGVLGLREWLAERFRRPGLPVRPENVLITSGGQQALDLLGRVLLNPHDAVVVENPTYLALLSAWRPWEVRFRGAASDSDGMRVNTLDALCAGESPKALYLVPNFQNPQGTTLSQPRRRQLAGWLRRRNVVAIEDDPYGELRYSGQPLPSLQEMEAETRESVELDSPVIRVGSFSKMLMPGLRVGWVIAARPVIEKLVMAKQAADLHCSTLSQFLVLELVRQGFLQEFVPLLCRTYGERRDCMLAALQKHLPGLARWTEPQGGMFLLVTLPEPIDTTALLSEALKQHVAFVPGEEFHLAGQGRNTLRLNFSNAQPRAIEAGVGRLAEVVKRAARQAATAPG